MTDDFTEDFDDDPLPEEFQEEEQPKVRRPAPAPQRAQRPAAPNRQVQSQAPASEPVQTQQIRFVPFELPQRIGIFDNMSGKPLMEESPPKQVTLETLNAKFDVIFGAVTDLMNRVNELEKNI